MTGRGARAASKVNKYGVAFPDATNLFRRFNGLFLAAEFRPPSDQPSTIMTAGMPRLDRDVVDIFVTGDFRADGVPARLAKRRGGFKNKHGGVPPFEKSAGVPL